MFINITVKSKNRNSILNFLKIFKNLSNNKKLQFSRRLLFFQSNQTNKLFTILTSPHVNKTAQEQFEFNLFSKKIKIKTFQVVKILVLLKKIQTTFFSDVFITVTFIFNFRGTYSFLVNNINPNKKNFKKFTRSKLKYKYLSLDLLLYNFYGKYKFI